MVNFVVFVKKGRVDSMLYALLKEIASEDFLLNIGFEKVKNVQL